MMMMMMMMMTMIRNRDTVATTPLNNSSLPVLSKNISMGPPFTLPPSVFRSSPPHLRSFSLLFLVRRPTTFLREPSILLFFQENWENWYVSTKEAFEKLASWREKGRGEKREKSARRIRRRGTKVERGEGNRCVVERDIFFFFLLVLPLFPRNPHGR